MEDKRSPAHRHTYQVHSGEESPPNLSRNPEPPVLLGICVPSELPAFTVEGVLPEGIYDTTLEEFRRRFATNTRRQEMWERLLAFLSLAACMGNFSHAYIGGSYISVCDHPDDIDLVLHCRYPASREAFVSIEPFFAFGLPNILEQYFVHLHFWIDEFPTITDFRSFFQQLRPQQAPEMTFGEDARKGLIRLKIIHTEISVATEDKEPQ